MWGRVWVSSETSSFFPFLFNFELFLCFLFIYIGKYATIKFIHYNLCLNSFIENEKVNIIIPLHIE